MIDLYCERMGPGLLGEPVNAVSNLVFFLSGWFVWRLALRNPIQGYSIRLLIILLFMIGFGSTVYHSFATHWAQMMDVIPISLFQGVYLWVYLDKVLKLQILYRILLMVLMMILAGIMSLFPYLLNGSVTYIPALLFVMGLGIWHIIKVRTERYILIIASGIFCLSLVFRSIDQILCPYFPVGSHFMWHLLNGLLLYLLMRGLILGYTKKG